MTVEIWRSLLPEPYEMVLQATRYCLRNSKYPPKPADIVDAMAAKVAPKMDPDQVWKEIRGAYMSLYSETDYAHAEQLHKELPELIRRVITPHDLIDYAFHMTSTDLNNFEKPRVLKAYAALEEQQAKKLIAENPLNQIASQKVKALEDKHGGV